MNRDYILIFMGLVISAIFLIILIPRSKVREAFVIFSFTQTITWLLGLTVVELRLIEYPARLFPYSNKTSFSFEYFIYPAISCIFVLYYPKNKNIFKKFMYYFYFCTTITIAEIFIERYTHIIKYIHWNWYITWISLFITLYIPQKFYEWFFKTRQNNE